MTSYFANSFSVNGIFHAIPHWDPDYQVLVVRGSPQSAVTIFLDDLMKDLQLHDIPIQPYLSCIYPDTPDILIIPSMKRVILNGNNLFSLLKTMTEDPQKFYFPIRELDLTQFCSNDLLDHYVKTIANLEEKVSFYQNEGVHFMSQLHLNTPPTGPTTKEMLLLLQSLIPVTAENTGRSNKVLASSITSSGWLSNLQFITEKMKRRYILEGSQAFLRTFFQLAESRAHNLNMRCHLVVNPLMPDQIEGIIFPEEQQAILMQSEIYSERNTLSTRPEDIFLTIRSDEHDLQKETNFIPEDFDRKMKLALGSLIKAHSFREELDEYYWHTLDLDQLFLQRRRVMHQLMALCDGQELWQYFR